MGGVRGGGMILACLLPVDSTKYKPITGFMSIFAQQKTFDRLEDRLRALELKCEGLERAKKGLDMEFTELYDKVSHQMSRMSKRHAAAQKANGPDPEEIPDNETSLGSDPISEAIHARRSRGFLSQ